MPSCFLPLPSFKYRVSFCRKLKLNNKKVQQAVVNVDGGLELLQASGFELVFDESSPEPQAAALSQRQESASPDGTTSPALSQSDSQPSILTSEVSSTLCRSTSHSPQAINAKSPDCCVQCVTPYFTCVSVVAICISRKGHHTCQVQQRTLKCLY